MKSMLTPRWSGPPGVQVRALSDRLRSTAGRWTVAEPSRPKFFEPRGRMTDPRLASLADFLLSPGKRKRNSSPEAAAEAAEGRPAEAAEGSCPAELRPRFADVLLTMEIDDAVADQEFATRHAASIAVAVAEAQRAAAVAAEAFHRVLLFSAAGEPDSGRGTADDERREGVTLPLADADQDDAILAPGGAPRQTPGCCSVEGAAVEAEAQAKAKAAKRGSRVGIEHEGSRMRFRVRPKNGGESKSFKYTAETKESVHQEALAYFQQA